MRRDKTKTIMALTQDSTGADTPEGGEIDEETGLNQVMGSTNGTVSNTVAHQSVMGANNPTRTTHHEGIQCNNLESAIRKLGIKMTREELKKELGDRTITKKDQLHLQMGWIESPGYFCAAAETGRDVASEYAESTVGSLPTHKFNKYTTTSAEFQNLPDTMAVGRQFKYMLEVYVNDFLGLAIPRSKADLNHLSDAPMHGIHDVFSATKDGAEDPIAEKKLKKKDGEW